MPLHSVDAAEERRLTLRSAFRSWRRGLRARATPYVQLPRPELLHLLHAHQVSPSGFRLWVYLFMLADESGELLRSDAEMAEALGLSARQVQRALRELRDRSLIERVRLRGKQLTLLRPIQPDRTEGGDA